MSKYFFLFRENIVHLQSILRIRTLSIVYMFHKNEPQEKRMQRIHVSSRDSARTPVQWSSAPNAGFCPPEAKPWFVVNENYREINAANQEEDPDSVLNFYRRCLGDTAAEPEQA